MKVFDADNKEDQQLGELTHKDFIIPNYVKEKDKPILDADLKEGDCVDRGMHGMLVKYRGEMIPLEDYKLIKNLQYAIKTI